MFNKFIAGVAVLASCCANPAATSEYPNRAIRLVTSEVGGGTDIAARLVARGLSAQVGQQVIVDNRAAGIIPGEIVSRAVPDGYTLLMHTSSFWLGPLLRATPYDPIHDFSPITITTISTNILVVHPAVNVKSVKDLIALAQNKRGELNYASASTGGTPHLAAELFKSMAGIDMVRVQYKGTGPAINALIAGEIQVSFPSASAVLPHVKSGRLRALGVTTSRPSSLAPGRPTVAETLPGYESVQMYGLFAPARTPESVIRVLNQEVARFLKTPATQNQISALGSESVGSTPQAFSAAIKAEVARMSKVIKDAGIKEE